MPDGARRKRKTEPAPGETKPPAIRCAACRTEVSRPDAVRVVAEGGPRHTFPNLGGVVFEIVTVDWSTNLVPASAPYAEWSWFPPYTWTVVLCAGCGTHLGWRYDATCDPPVFWALIIE